MRNSFRALPLFAIPAMALGVASPAFASSPMADASAVASGQLASTGAEITGWIVAAIVFLGLGAVLFFISSRQRAKARAKDEAGAVALSESEAEAATLASTTDDASIDAGENPVQNPGGNPGENPANTEGTGDNPPV